MNSLIANMLGFFEYSEITFRPKNDFLFENTARVECRPYRYSNRYTVELFTDAKGSRGAIKVQNSQEAFDVVAGFLGNDFIIEPSF